MEEFKGVSERFNVSLLSDEGQDSERVVCQIGLDGLFVLSQDGKRTLRKYPLNHISRWALRGSSLVLYTKTPVDVEERTVTLQSDDRTIRSALDTLTSCCMQLVELLQSGDKSGETTQATNSLTALLNGGPPRKASLPSAEDVEFWVAPEKAGWLQSQGDHIKTWRRRWFVLKQGYLFRFASPDVTSASKPRGLVDLSKVTDVSEARDATGRNNSLLLSTPTGRVLYVADSETEQVEWVSALEGSLAKIMKQIAGVDDAPPPAPAPAAQSSSAQSAWAAQLEKSYGAASSGRGSSGGAGGGGRSASDRNNTMVKVVGYAGQEAATAPRASSHGRAAAAPYDSRDYATTGGIGYDNIAGIAGIRTTGSSAPSRAASGSTFTDSFVKVDYPSYPVLAPTPASHHAHHQQQASYSAPDSGSYGLMFGGSAYSATQGGPQQQQQPQRQEAPAYGYSQQGSQQPQQAYQGFSSHQSSHQLQPQQQEQQHQGTPQYAGYSSTPEPTLQDGQGYGSGAAYSYQQQPQPHQQQQHQAAPGMGAPAMQQAQSWQQLCADNGQPYYYNSSTGITQWEQPAGFV